jgi:hypothetical protein
MPSAKFNLGQTVATPGALAAFTVNEQTPIAFLYRHISGDWGNLDPEDRAANDRALDVGERILSAYELADGTRIWIITEADRSSTCVLLPEEY